MSFKKSPSKAFLPHKFYLHRLSSALRTGGGVGRNDLEKNESKSFYHKVNLNKLL